MDISKSKLAKEGIEVMRKIDAAEKLTMTEKKLAVKHGYIEPIYITWKKEKILTGYKKTQKTINTIAILKKDGLL